MQRYRVNTFLRILPLLIAIATGLADSLSGIMGMFMYATSFAYILGAIIGILIRLAIVCWIPLLWLIGSSTRRKKRKGLMITVGCLATTGLILAIAVGLIAPYNTYLTAAFSGSTIFITFMAAWPYGIIVSVVYLINKILMIILAFTTAAKAKYDNMPMNQPPYSNPYQQNPGPNYRQY